MPAFVDLGNRWFRGTILLVLLVAGVWRGVMATRLPVISRDGVTFCWYARDLGTEGLQYMRSPQARQHPLYPAIILGVQRVARALGAADTPLTWQRSGQVISWLAGMTVIVLVGAVTTQLVRRLDLPLNERLATVAAMLWAAVLDLNVWLSSDVMSDQVHVAFYLAAVLLLLQLDTLPRALACGVLSGLAFLTRPEGALPVMGGLAVLATCWRQVAVRKLVARAAVLALGFLVCAVPYWCAVGRISPKKDPLQWLRPAAAAQTEAAPVAVRAGMLSPPSLLAKLERLALPWYALVPHAAYKLLRAGRVAIPVLALLLLYGLRKRLLTPALAGWTVCLIGHLGLALVLLGHYGYLDPRHMLVPVLLLMPMAALLLSRELGRLTAGRHVAWAGALLAACFLPSAAYALRVPNEQDAFLAAAAQWLTTTDPQVTAKRLLSGSSPQRIAFYAGMRWESWAEKPDEYAVLARQIRAGGPGYFALEVGPGFERTGNRAVLDQLQHDEQLTPYLGAVHVRPGPKQTDELYLIELRLAP